jgi:hypothetical protein
VEDDSRLLGNSFACSCRRRALSFLKSWFSSWSTSFFRGNAPAFHPGQNAATLIQE